MSNTVKRSNVDLLVQGAVLGATVASVVVGGAFMGLYLYRNNSNKAGRDYIDGWVGIIAEKIGDLVWNEAIIPIAQLVPQEDEE